MKFSDMFRDDATRQLSLGRVASAVILVYLLVYGGILIVNLKTFVDIPANWLAAMLSFYGFNKTASVVTKIKGASDGES